MGKHGLVMALSCIIAFSTLSVAAAETPVGKTGANPAANTAEAYVAEWESGKMVLKKTHDFNAFMSMPPYETAEEAYIVDRDSITMKPTLRSDNINRLMSMPPYEASTDPASYSHPAALRADVAQAADPEASPVSQQCDWCYDQKS